MTAAPIASTHPLLEEWARQGDAHQRARVLRDAYNRTRPRMGAAWRIAYDRAALRQEAIGNGTAA